MCHYTAYIQQLQTFKNSPFLCPTLQNQYYMYTACSAVKAYAASHCTNERRDTAYSTVVLPWHVTVLSVHNCTWLRYCLLAVLTLVYCSSSVIAKRGSVCLYLRHTHEQRLNGLGYLTKFHTIR